MKLSTLLQLALGLTAAIAEVHSAAAKDDVTATATFYPQRITYQDLKSGDDSTQSLLLEALTVDGLLSITDIPGRFDDDANKVMRTLHACATASSATMAHQFADGTLRLTLATHTVPNGQQALKHGSGATTTDCCERWDAASTSFRRAVHTVTQFFAKRLAATLAMDDEEPLLHTATGFAFYTIEDVIQAGQHLEHFHSYQKAMTGAAGTFDDSEQPLHTIDRHTDQGLFLVFSPGRMVSQEGNDNHKISSGFYIETMNGSVAHVEFSSDDDLIIMLGDGVNQYLNNRLPSHQQLRAVPHSLRMPIHHDAVDNTRVWYGRMVLPPFDAIHPTHNITFGELRERMMTNDADDDVTHKYSEALALGCSGSRIARELTDTNAGVSCGTNALYCWHQCMDFADYNVSEATCHDLDLTVNCINPRLQVSNGSVHGDYYPGCIAADAQMETPIPSLPNYPRDDSACSDFNDFANMSGYNYTAVLLEDVSVLQWNLRPDEKGQVTLEARLAFNGLFGWLGLGLANVTGLLNGMLGAKVILARPGDNYTGFSGLDLSMDSNVNEFQIDQFQTPFRIWGTSETSISSDDNESNLSSAVLDVSPDCFTAMKIITTSIKGQDFNFSGTDEMLWAANGQDPYMMYHGANRGRFSVHWPTGEVTLLSSPPHEDDQIKSTTAPQEAISAASTRLVSMSMATTLFLGVIAMRIAA